jgi:hypothetical protein
MLASKKSLLLVFFFSLHCVGLRAQIQVEPIAPDKKNITIDDLWNFIIIHPSTHKSTLFVSLQLQEEKYGPCLRLESLPFKTESQKTRISSENISIQESTVLHPDFMDIYYSQGFLPPGSYSVCLEIVSYYNQNVIHMNCYDFQIHKSSACPSQKTKNISHEGHIRINNTLSDQPEFQNNISDDYLLLSIQEQILAGGIPLDMKLFLNHAYDPSQTRINQGFSFNGTEFRRLLLEKYKRALNNKYKKENLDALFLYKDSLELALLNKKFNHPQFQEEIQSIRFHDSLQKLLALDSNALIIKEIQKYRHSHALVLSKKEAYEKILEKRHSLTEKIEKCSFQDSLNKLIKKQNPDIFSFSLPTDKMDKKQLKQLLKNSELLNKSGSVLFNFNGIHIGMHQPYISELSLSQVLLKGFQSDFDAGRFNFFLSTGKSIPLQGSAINNNELLKKISTFSLAYGNKRGNYIRLYMMYARDDTSQTGSLSNFENNTVQSDPINNRLLGLCSAVRIQKNLHFHFECSGSYTENILYSQNISGFMQDSLWISTGTNKNWVEDILRQRSSFSGASVDYAMNSTLRLNIPAKNSDLFVRYRRIGENYHSSGSPYLPTGILEYETGVQKSLFKRQLNAEIYMKKSEDCIRRDTILNSDQVKYGAHVAVMIKGFPGISIRYTPHRMGAFYNHYLLNGTCQYQWKTGKYLHYSTIAYSNMESTHKQNDKLYYTSIYLNHQSRVHRSISLQFNCNLHQENSADSVMHLLHLQQSITYIRKKSSHKWAWIYGQFSENPGLSGIEYTYMFNNNKGLGTRFSLIKKWYLKNESHKEIPARMHAPFYASLEITYHW